MKTLPLFFLGCLALSSANADTFAFPCFDPAKGYTKVQAYVEASKTEGNMAFVADDKCKKINPKFVVNAAQYVTVPGVKISRPRFTEEKFVKDEKGNLYMFLVGKVQEKQYTLDTSNDEDLTGERLEEAGIVPRDDDYGRTGSFFYDYLVKGSNGSLNVRLNNVLFSEKTNNANVENEQNIEEHLALEVVSRRFKDPKRGGTYVVMGAKIGAEVQSGLTISYLQKLIHDISPESEDRPIVDRKGKDFLVAGYYGRGFQAKIFDNKVVKLYVNAEVYGEMSTKLRDDTGIHANLETHLELHPATDKWFPMVELVGYLNNRVNVKGDFEYNQRVELVIRLFKMKGWSVDFGTGVSKWDENEDRLYEKKKSWNTNMFFRVRRKL